LPLSDRDYMRAPPPQRVTRRARINWSFGLNPVLVIIAVNIIIFIATVIVGKVIVVYDGVPLGTMYKLNYYLGLQPETFLERPWTIITNMFVHAGFGHLFGNMITLFFFGRFLAKLVGDNKFLLVYLGGGIVGNIFYLLIGLWLDPLSIAVGASGAVYAIAGALVVMTPKLRVLLWFFVPMPLWVLVLVFFVIWSIPGLIPGIAWQAHLGGLLSGIIAGFFLRGRMRYIIIR
jgi:membrane associated rhomboid family serine protease